MAATIRVGTSGWHYAHWRGNFYPLSLHADAWLPRYAEDFDTVELNNSFYHLPTKHAWLSWRDAVPEPFVFAVKASRYITHVKRLNVEPASIEKFFAGARLLGEHLGPVLYQLPPTFHRTEENAARLERFVPMLPAGITHVFEFRHDSWFVEETFAQLDRFGAAFCSFDMPGLRCPLRVTGGVLYMRFHGANARYGGDYHEEALRDWAARLAEAAQTASRGYAYFNNDAGGIAPRNARTLRSLLAAVNGR